MKNITCMCEHKFKADIPAEVDLEKHPETLTAISDGTFMNVVCPACGTVLKPEFPFKIFNRQESWEIDFVPELERREKMKHPPRATGKKRLRLVIGYAELLEKTKIFGEQLDDRVIEYLKYIILSKVLEKTESEDKEITVFYNRRQGEELEFHIQGLKSGELGVFKIPMASYARALEEIDRRTAEPPFTEFLSPPHVSLNRLYSWDDL